MFIKETGKIETKMISVFFFFLLESNGCGEKGLLLVGELGLLIREASPAAEHGL